MTEGKPYLEKIKQLETSLEKQKEINKEYVDEVEKLQHEIKELEKSTDRYKELYYQQVDKYNELWDAIPDELAEELLKLMEINK